MPSIKPRVDGHYGGYMIDPQYERVPRDWDEHMLALEEADKAPSLTKAEGNLGALLNALDPLGPGRDADVPSLRAGPD